MDIFDQLLKDARDAMPEGQAVVQTLLTEALSDHEQLAAAIRSRPKPWFFAADDTLTVFCTEGHPGNASAPHDHGTWSVLGCFAGSEESWWHQHDEAGFQTVGSGVLRAGQAHALPSAAIHSVMNRWDQPNGIIHIYEGNFLATHRRIWDPVTHEQHTAGLAEPLAPSGQPSLTRAETVREKPQIAGTAFVAVRVNQLEGVANWMAETFGLQTLTTHEDSCAVEDRYSYLIEPGSLTIVGLHTATSPQPAAGLHHLALRVPSITELENWHSVLSEHGRSPSPITVWNFGSFVDVSGPEQLTVRLFVPAVR